MRIKISILFIIVSCSLNGLFAENQGDSLFWEHCARCHKINRELTGPDLVHIREKRELNWILDFVRNSTAVIQAGDPIATELYRDYKQVEMPANDLNDTQIIAILDYIDQSTQKASTNAEKIIKIPDQDKNINHRFIRMPEIIFLILSLLYFSYLLIFRKKKNSYLYAIHPGFMTGAYLLVVLILSGFIRRDYLKFKESLYLGDMEQAVVFSHKVHYTDYEIDCYYCHADASRKQQANLPNLQLCMKCHHYIDEGEQYGKTEIAKISKLTEQNQPIIWQTGYRFSKYTHFDHVVHNKVLNMACTDCHTQADNPLISSKSFTMKWCIDCHKSTRINTENQYYTNYTSDKELTGTKAGLLDCNTCHF